MAETSAIFISIDEYQQAHLKLLCDEIFGEKNCLATFIRKTKTITGDNASGLNIQHEFLLVYAKDRKKVVLRGEKKKFEKYSNPDNDPKGDWIAGDPSAKSGGLGTCFEIVNPFTGQVDLPPKGRYWAFSKETMKEYIKNGRIKFRMEIKKNQREFLTSLQEVEQQDRQFLNLMKKIKGKETLFYATTMKMEFAKRLQ